MPHTAQTPRPRHHATRPVRRTPGAGTKAAGADTEAGTKAAGADTGADTEAGAAAGAAGSAEQGTPGTTLRRPTDARQHPLRNPRILQEFEQRLEGAVEGFFARAFRSGLQPVELAKGVRRYAEQQRLVAADAVVVPNAYRFRVHPKDHARLMGFGPRLVSELAAVVEETARDEAWAIAGPVHVELVADEQVDYGMFRLVGRVDAEAEAMPPVTSNAPTDADAGSDREDQHDQHDQGAATTAKPAPGAARHVAPSGLVDTTDVDMTGAFGAGGAPTLALPDGTFKPLAGSRMVAGRTDQTDITVDHATVSREHAAFVRRGDGWWVLDLGSTNGTRVNGRAAAEQPIRPGDQVELGEAVVEVVER